MGLVKRGKVWWMDVMYQGSRIRRSTGTGDKRLADAILGKVKSQIIEGVFFEKNPEPDRTFEDMMTRYVAERSVLKAPKSRIRDSSALKHLLPVFGPRLLGH
ncbi:MAG: site-specific integrase, partial [Nitrospira sp.]|nr:site-specific integrase [Nitrospira sp.]